MKKLYGHGVPVECKSGTAIDLFYLLAKKGGNTQILKFLISIETPADQQKRSTLLTPLSIAAYKGHLETVAFLHIQGANVNNLSKTKMTPLYMAARRRQYHIVKYLCTLPGVLEYMERTEENNAFLYALKNNELELLHIVIAAQPAILEKTIGDPGEYPLTIVSRMNLVEAVEIIGSHTKNLDTECPRDCLTPYMFAVLNELFGVADVLMQLGANVKYLDHEKHTVAQIAFKNHNEHALNYLKNRGVISVPVEKRQSLLYPKSNSGIGLLNKIHYSVNIGGGVSNMIIQKGQKRPIPIMREIQGLEKVQKVTAKYKNKYRPPSSIKKLIEIRIRNPRSIRNRTTIMASTPVPDIPIFTPDIEEKEPYSCESVDTGKHKRNMTMGDIFSTNATIGHETPISFTNLTTNYTNAKQKNKKNKHRIREDFCDSEDEDISSQEKGKEENKSNRKHKSSNRKEKSEKKNKTALILVEGEDDSDSDKISKKHKKRDRNEGLVSNISIERKSRDQAIEEKNSTLQTPDISSPRKSQKKKSPLTIEGGMKLPSVKQNKPELNTKRKNKFRRETTVSKKKNKAVSLEEAPITSDKLSPKSTQNIKDLLKKDCSRESSKESMRDINIIKSKDEIYMSEYESDSDFNIDFSSSDDNTPTTSNSKYNVPKGANDGESKIAGLFSKTGILGFLNIGNIQEIKEEDNEDDAQTQRITSENPKQQSHLPRKSKSSSNLLKEITNSVIKYSEESKGSESSNESNESNEEVKELPKKKAQSTLKLQNKNIAGSLNIFGSIANAFSRKKQTKSETNLPTIQPGTKFVKDPTSGKHIPIDSNNNSEIVKMLESLERHRGTDIGVKRNLAKSIKPKGISNIAEDDQQIVRNLYMKMGALNNLQKIGNNTPTNRKANQSPKKRNTQKKYQEYINKG